MKVRVRLSIGIVNAVRQDTIEIPDEYLDGFDPEHREQVISEYVDIWSNEIIDIGWEELP